MKSIKPGRGPSAMGGIGSIFAGVFGIIWVIAVSNMGAPPFFALFGVVFIIMAIVQAVYHFKNAAGKNRMSLFDVTDHHAEPDPLNEYFNRPQASSYQSSAQAADDSQINFCPYCGTRVADESYRFCASCGKEIKKATM